MCIYYDFWEYLEKNYYDNEKYIKKLCAQYGNLRCDYEQFLKIYYDNSDHNHVSDFDIWDDGVFLEDHWVSMNMIKYFESAIPEYLS